MYPVLDHHRIETALQFLKLELYDADLYLPYRLEFQYLFKFRIELIKLRSRVLQQQLIKMLLTYIVIALLKHLILVLFYLLKYMQITFHLACNPFRPLAFQCFDNAP